MTTAQETAPLRCYDSRVAMINTLPPDSVVAEIGVQIGDFAAEILKTQPYRLYLVDIWRQQKGDYEADVANVDDAAQEANYQTVLRRFAREIETGQVVVIRKPSLEAAKDIVDGLLDAVYLDANHTRQAVLEDLYAWEPKLNETGRIMGHDYTDRDEAKLMGFGVIEAVRDFCLSGEWRMTGITDEEWPSYELERVT